MNQELVIRAYQFLTEEDRSDHRYIRKIGRIHRQLNRRGVSRKTEYLIHPRERLITLMQTRLDKEIKEKDRKKKKLLSSFNKITK
jgi:hypothetical protein